MIVYLLVLLTFVACIIFSEVAFRIWYRRAFGRSYFVSLKFPWNEMHVVTHPFLTFAYQKNGRINLNQKLPYELHPDIYTSFKEPLQLNQYGHFGGNWTLKKEAGKYRIACLGNSTTANNIGDATGDHTYPQKLEEQLRSAMKTAGVALEPEVLNCGIGGWVSVDIVINFILNILPLRPDMVVINHGFTDLHLYMTEDFCLDYSHGRKNLAESLWRIRIAHVFPKLKFWHSYEYLKDRLLGTGNTRNDVAKFTRTGKMNTANPYSDMSCEAEIMSAILVLCKFHGIECMMCSYPFFAYKEDPLTLKIKEGVETENLMWKHLATDFNTEFVDLEGAIPKHKDYFLDWIHFTPKGMEMVANVLADKIVALLKAKSQSPLI